MESSEIKRVLDSESGKSLKSYLLQELSNLRDIVNIKEYSKAQDQAVELKAQKKAYDKLKKILETIITIEDSVEPEEKEDYGL